MRTFPIALAAPLALVLSAGAARAQTPPADLDFAPLPPPEAPAAPALTAPRALVGLHLGGIFPQPFNKLGTSFAADVDASWQLPVLERRLGIFLGAGYTQPSTTGAMTDPRIVANGGQTAYTLTVRDLGVSLGALWLQPLTRAWSAYGGLGVTMHLTRSVMEQHAGTTDLGQTTEDATRFGPLLRAGAGYALGPGMLTLEARYSHAAIAELVTGEANTAHLSTQLGYALGF